MCRGYYMAKKAPINNPAFSPVKSGLVHAVLNQSVSSGTSPVAHRADSAIPRSAQRYALQPDRQAEPRSIAERRCEQRSREKRVLMFPSEEISVNDLVNKLASSGATSLKFSHLLRACILVLRHCEKELIERVVVAQPLIRPANSNSLALEEFEHRLAQFVASAIRRAPPMP